MSRHFDDEQRDASHTPYRCPTCGDPLRFEILDDERFVVAWSCLSCGAVRTTEPG